MIAWHYTTGQATVQIIRSGAIRAQPAAWLSIRSSIDPSACRVVMRDGRPYRLSVGEMHRAFSGWFRFGVPAGELLSPERVRRLVDVRRDAWRTWQAHARSIGADVGDWLASLEPVALERCRLERLEGHPSSGTWRHINDPRAWASAELDQTIARAFAIAAQALA